MRYRPARFTQRIAVTNDRDSITPVPRSATEAKYQVPGGLVGVVGWRSSLYKFIPGRLGLDREYSRVERLEFPA